MLLRFSLLSYSNIILRWVLNWLLIVEMMMAALTNWTSIFFPIFFFINFFITIYFPFITILSSFKILSASITLSCCIPKTLSLWRLKGYFSRFDFWYGQRQIPSNGLWCCYYDSIDSHWAKCLLSYRKPTPSPENRIFLFSLFLIFSLISFAVSLNIELQLSYLSIQKERYLYIIF